MATNIFCYYNLAHKQGISMVLPIVRNKIGKKQTKLADCHTCIPCHDNISAEVFLGRYFFVTCMFHSGIFLVPSAQLLLLVLLFVQQFWGLLSLQKCIFFFFLMSLLASFLSEWFCLFACSGILWVQKLRSPMLRTQSCEIFSV